jgi:hypothetical protein
MPDSSFLLKNNPMTAEDEAGERANPIESKPIDKRAPSDGTVGSSLVKKTVGAEPLRLLADLYKSSWVSECTVCR